MASKEKHKEIEGAATFGFSLAQSIPMPYIDSDGDEQEVTMRLINDEILFPLTLNKDFMDIAKYAVQQSFKRRLDFNYNDCIAQGPITVEPITTLFNIDQF